MHPIMPDQNIAVIENQHRTRERAREIANIRLAQTAEASHHETQEAEAKPVVRR
jgi:hypothetical protein